MFSFVVFFKVRFSSPITERLCLLFSKTQDTFLRVRDRHISDHVLKSSPTDVDEACGRSGSEFSTTHFVETCWSWERFNPVLQNYGGKYSVKAQREHKLDKRALQLSNPALTESSGPGEKVYRMLVERHNCVGHSRQMLPELRHLCQLSLVVNQVWSSCCVELGGLPTVLQFFTFLRFHPLLTTRQLAACNGHTHGSPAVFRRKSHEKVLTLLLEMNSLTFG